VIDSIRLIKYIRERCKILKRIAQQEGSTLRGYVVAQLFIMISLSIPTQRLGKFSHDCELIWRKNVILDEQEEIARMNRVAAQNNEPTQLFTYA